MTDQPVNNSADGNYQYADGRILVFAKTPIAGQVKTRLAADIGARAALDVYKRLLESTLETVFSCKLSPVELWLDTATQTDWLRELMTQYPVVVRLQSEGDLGARMANAMSETLQEADFCVLIGADCPLIDSDYLEKACTALKNGTEIVIGPAEDGGYVLVGMTSDKPELFSSIDWSTAAVMQQTRQVINVQNWRHQELSILWDIDRSEDWRRWTSMLESMHRLKYVNS